MNPLMLIAMGIIIILILICFVLIMINSSKINTLLDYSEEGDIIGALKEYYSKIDDLAKTVDTLLLFRGWQAVKERRRCHSKSWAL